MSDGLDLFICTVSVFVMIPVGYILVYNNRDVFEFGIGIFMIIFGIICLFLETYATNGMLYGIYEWLIE